MQFKQGVTHLGIGSVLWLMSHSVLADTVLLDPATLAVGATVGEYLVVKEGCPDPYKTDCQPTEKMKYVSAVAGRLGKIEFPVNLTDNFEIDVNVDWMENFEQHTITLFKADNESESSLFVRFTYYWANQIEFDYSGRHNPSGNLGWQDESAINNVELSIRGGVAYLNINGTPFKDEDSKESDTVTLEDLGQPYVKLVIGGIREDERLFEVTLKGGTGGTTPVTGSGDFDSGKQAGIQQCVSDPASCGITVTIGGDSVCQFGCTGVSSCIHATYNPSAGEVHIPLIDVPGPFGDTQTYEVYLIQQPLTFAFDLDMNRIIAK